MNISLLKKGATKATAKTKRTLFTRTHAIQMSAFVLFIFAWWSVTRFGHIDPVILPSPGQIVSDLVNTNLCKTPSAGSVRAECGVQDYILWQHLLATLQRIIAGLSIAIVIGVPTGCLLGTSRSARVIIEPYLAFLRALPPLGYIGLLIVWFGIGGLAYVSGTQLNTSLTIACIVVIGAVALIIDQTLIRAEHAFAPWKARQ